MNSTPMTDSIQFIGIHKNGDDYESVIICDVAMH